MACGNMNTYTLYITHVAYVETRTDDTLNDSVGRLLVWSEKTAKCTRDATQMFMTAFAQIDKRSH